MRVVIDCGHGGDETETSFGAKGVGETLEKNINLLVGGNLVFWLHKYGHEVKVTRKTDIDVSLRERVEMANNWEADLFVSLHCNGNDDQSYEGIECYTSKGHTAADTWAARFQNALLKAFPDHKDFAGKGPSEENFYVLRNTVPPAVLIEIEFITNPKQEKFLNENYAKIAKVIADELGNIKEAKKCL